MDDGGAETSIVGFCGGLEARASNGEGGFGTENGFEAGSEEKGFCVGLGDVENGLAALLVEKGFDPKRLSPRFLDGGSSFLFCNAAS